MSKNNLSSIDEEIKKLEKKKKELLAQKELEIQEENLKKIKSAFMPGTIKITEPKKIDGCKDCDYKRFEDGKGMIDEYYYCNIGGGEVWGSRHPYGANFTLDCPFIKPGAKEKYIKEVKDAIEKLNKILKQIE